MAETDGAATTSRAATGTGDPAGAMTGGPAPPSLRRHLPEIDLFRLLTFACVIAIHVCAAATTRDSVGSNAAQMLLHFTREAFFALTGFVLTFQAVRRPQTVGRFWRRRIPLVLWPYVVWTVLYALLAVVTRPPQMPPPQPGDQLWQVLTDLVSGSGWYHLYFLLVTLQVYLVYPALLPLLRRMGSRGHAAVMVVSLALQLLSCRLLSVPPAGEFGAWLTAHGFATLIAYQLYPVLGIVAALHLDRFQTLVHRHRVAIGLAAAAGVVVAELAFTHLVAAGSTPSVVAGVFQPAILPYFLVVVVALYTLSLQLTSRWPAGGRARQILAYGSDRSFAIFLVHPLVLTFLLPVSGAWTETIGPIPVLLALYVGTVAGTILVAELTRRVPGSTALTGRPRIPARWHRGRPLGPGQGRP